MNITELFNLIFGCILTIISTYYSLKLLDPINRLLTKIYEKVMNFFFSLDK